MEKIVGYANIKHDATDIITSGELKDFQGKIVRVLEFGEPDGILAVNSEGNALAMIEKDAISSSFKCSIFNDVICPPKMADDILAQCAYSMKCHSRKGGYDKNVKGVVIATSLAKGVFTDSFLFDPQLQNS